jgi:hypothetical protein
MIGQISALGWTKRLLLLVVLIPILSCATVKNIVYPPTPTPTRIPFADMDLKDLALQRTDLPAGYVEFDVPDLQVAFEQFEGSSNTDILDNLEKGFGCFFSSPKDSGAFINIILVYEDMEDAENAFDEYLDNQRSGTKVDVATVGEESIGIKLSSGGQRGYLIAWRYQEVFVLLAYAGDDDIGINEMVRLAELIQSRLEG